MIEPKALFKSQPKRFTKSQRQVVDYLITHPDEAVFLSAAGLGARLGVSDATVVRVCQAIGYKGITQLKQHLRKLIFQGRDTVSRMEETVGGITSTQDLITRVMQTDLDNLSKAINVASQDTIHQAASILAGSGEVAIIGLRSAHALAIFLSSALRYLGRKVQMLTPGIVYIWAEARALGPSSVLVAFAFPRYTTLTIQVAKEAHRNGAKVIAVTDSTTSPLAQNADFVLTAACSIDSFMGSFVAALSILNALVTAVAHLDGKNSLEHLRKLERTWEEKGV